MSVLAVEVREIESSVKHANADRLDISRVKGLDYQFVTGREQYAPGDLVVYFPIDTIMPANIQEIVGVVGKLSGANKNRVKTVKLRGEISQGIVAPVAPFADLIGADLREGADVTELLGCEKYEPPVISVKGARLMTLPEGVEYYDLENAERHGEALQYLLDNDVFVWVSEKLEGTNFAVVAKVGQEAIVCSRRHSLVQDGDNEPDLIKVARRDGWIALAESLLEKFNASQVVVRGELIGAGWQGNIYRMKDNRVYLFDIKVDGRYLSPVEMFGCVSPEHIQQGINIVPTIWIGKLSNWLDGKTLKEASNGKSLLHDTLREGVVIKPLLADETFDRLGRLVLKQRSPEYLAGSDS